jgi:hypothetical protein
MKRFLSLGILVLALGCGDSLKLHEVTGTLTLENGKPITQGMIETMSDGSTGAKVNASAQINKDGTFTLETVGKKGAVAGTHKVVLIGPPGNSDLPIDKQPRREFDIKYQDYGSSDLTLEVKAGIANKVTLKVQPNKN